MKLMTLDTNIAKKILANQTQQYIKRIIHHVHMRFVPGMPGRLNTHKTTNVLHHINKIKDKKHMIITIDRNNF